MRLSREDWTKAALQALAEDGLSAVAVEPLARRLGATKGSFYWHFKDRDDLIAATLQRWETEDTAAVIEQVVSIDDPYQRLLALADEALGGALSGGYDAAILAAATDPRVQPALVRVTNTRMDFIERLYRDLGVGKKEARQHARLTYSLFLGMSQLGRAEGGKKPSHAAIKSAVDTAVRGLLLSAGIQPAST